MTNDVTITWQYQNITWWNEACIKVLETFGTPGKKYMTSATEDYLIFQFESAKDATLCRILLSEYLQ